MAGPLIQLRSRRSWRRHQLGEIGRDLGHRLVVFFVVVFLVGLLLRVVVA
jgi:hypothetical protein